MTKLIRISNDVVNELDKLKGSYSEKIRVLLRKPEFDKEILKKSLREVLEEFKGYQ